jgi:hypothetical protein
MKIRKQNNIGQFQSAPISQTPKLPPTPEQIRQRAHDIYVARGGAEGMALSDWLMAEEELKRKLEG